jgi:hypothetical protein
MTPDEERAARAYADLCRECGYESPIRRIGQRHAGVLLAEIDRLRALPVLATCGACGWHVDFDGARECVYPRTRMVVGAVESVASDPPPAWCPLRGAR